MRIDWRVNSSVRLVLDEVFGSARSLNQITWKRIYSHSDANRFGIVDDTLLFYSKSETYNFNNNSNNNFNINYYNNNNFQVFQQIFH